jgi:flagellar hook-associated protein 2
MSTSPITSPLTTLTGSNTFAADLQNSVNRAVSIASLPIQQLIADQNKVTSQIGELNQLGSLFSTLQTSIQSIASGTGSNAQTASVSDSSVVQASVTNGALAGTYTVQVLDPGSSSSAMSNAPNTPVTDPTSENISQSTSFTLTIDTTTYAIQASNLNALAAAINSSGAPAQAIVVNLGSPEQPDYRLVIQSTALSDIAVQLNDGANNSGTDLMSSLTTGGNASYTVDGQPPGGISSDSKTVTIAPGVNVTLQSAGTSTVTVSGSTANLSSALSSFVNAYNAVVTELQKNHGQSGGALTGDSGILEMQSALRQLMNYTGVGGSIKSLTQLGIAFTQQGTLIFDSGTLSGLSQTQISDAMSFLGDPASGGFLQLASNTLSGIDDSTTGIIANETQAKQTQTQQEQDSINQAQARVNQLQANLQAQMAAADALIATLQQQNQFLQGLFQYSTSNNPNAGTAG